MGSTIADLAKRFGPLAVIILAAIVLVILGPSPASPDDGDEWIEKRGDYFNSVTFTSSPGAYRYLNPGSTNETNTDHGLTYTYLKVYQDTGLSVTLVLEVFRNNAWTAQTIAIPSGDAREFQGVRMKGFNPIIGGTPPAGTGVYFFFER